MFYPWTLWIIDVSMVIVGWILFMLIFLFHSKSRQTYVKERDIRSWYGFGFEIIGYAIIATCLRFSVTSFLQIGMIVEAIFTLAAAAFIAASLLFTRAAVRALGRQWSIGAQVLEDHELVTQGVYGVVRHPIYTGMFSMFIGCALAISSWWAMLIGGALFLAGTMLRIQSEEKLLIAQFGDAYRDYARRVPALIPWKHRA